MDDDPIVSRTTVRFNSVYVIESLPDGELKTGRDLYDSIVFPASQKLDGVYTEFLRAYTRQDFARHLAEIKRGAALGNHHPIIHIEAHGSQDGIAMADGTEMKWKTLIPLFGDINQTCRMNLIVVAISCMGWNLTTSLIPSDRAPVNMVIGPVGVMRAGELLQATRRFYATLFSRLDVNDALSAMNDGQSYGKWRIKPGLAEILFCRVFRQYISELTTPEILQQREDEIVAQVVGTESVDPQQLDRLRTSIRHDLRDSRQLYDRFRRTFLMMDLFPEDAERFGLTYERCIPAAAV